jgi:hypothetical protein
VRLNVLLDQVEIKAEVTKLDFTADDGYSTEVDLAAVRGCADCLVAFTDTPGKVSLVMPGMEGLLSLSKRRKKKGEWSELVLAMVKNR